MVYLCQVRSSNEFCTCAVQSTRVAKMADPGSQASSSTKDLLLTFATELVTSPINLALLGVCGYLLYKIIGGRRQDTETIPREPELPRMKKQDMTLEQIRKFDGKGDDGRLLMAVNGKVFDVTRGKRFYGPGNWRLSLAFRCDRWPWKLDKLPANFCTLGILF